MTPEPSFSPLIATSWDCKATKSSLPAMQRNREAEVGCKCTSKVFYLPADGKQVNVALLQQELASLQAWHYSLQTLYWDEVGEMFRLASDE